jgi:hypothetical protein
MDIFPINTAFELLVRFPVKEAIQQAYAKIQACFRTPKMKTKHDTGDLHESSLYTS